MRKNFVPRAAISTRIPLAKQPLPKNHCRSFATYFSFAQRKITLEGEFMNERNRRHLSCEILLGAVLLVLTQTAAFAQTTVSTSNTLAAVQPVANACPRFAAGSVVQQPAAFFSQDGELSVQFSYQTTTDFANRTLFCFMTPSGLENPTLHVKPGDHLIITVTNNTSAQPLYMTIDPPNCGPGGTQMTLSSLNIHYHGTNTSPTCHSDEVVKTLINSGQTFQYNVVFPSDEPPGLYWYHPHVHGISEHALLGGACGALVVDGIEDIQPAVSDLRQQIMVIRDQPTIQGLNEGTGGDPEGIPYRDLTVNDVPNNAMTDAKNVTTYTPAILHMAAGEKQFWRVANATADTILDLQVQFDGVPQTVQVVAIDGVSVNSQDGAQPGGLIAVNHFRLPPASRVEFIVNAPSSKVKMAQLVTLNIPSGTYGDDDPTRPIFNLQVLTGRAAEEPANDDRVGHFTALNSNQKRFAGLAAEPIAVKRLVFFNENQPTQFFMDVEGQPEILFDPNAAPAITATQGTAEEWTVENHTMENHEFHIHQIHFLVESQNNFEINGIQQAPGITGQYLDTIEVPYWDGNPAHPFPSVSLRIDFRGNDTGDFVFHCHILNHEDQGMMNIIRVVPQAAAAVSRGSKKATPSINTSAPSSIKTSTGGIDKMVMK
jgi:FtsP/CotA-like multicopper oxidase with cupredoxin domain